MIHVAKDFHAPPPALQACAAGKQANLLEHKERHSFDPACYHREAIEALCNLYPSTQSGTYKCAYCESYIYPEQKKSVDHYRPKGNGYYWLAYEWSNLLLACWDCNNVKDNAWEQTGRKVKIPPSNPADSRADSTLMLAEKASCLNPELDNPADFFSLAIDGKLIATGGNRRATWTIETLGLNKRGLPNQRIKLVSDLIKLLEGQAERLFSNYKIAELESDERPILMAFSLVFEKMYALSHPKQAYSFVGLMLIRDMDDLLWQPLISEIGEPVVNWIKYAFEVWKNAQELS